ncbi:hypothetical protein OG589_36125 [Sphaerisporangium sp. NBC_01403]|uniref:hypothetical protein n=1 Tax=Sphaerisporangium sp. NBC_01403 TaxID=2903599 RepID=UPI00324D8494
MYFYDETWFTLQPGMAELHLSNCAQAVELLASGLVRLPESYRETARGTPHAWARCARRGQHEHGLPIVADAIQLNRHAVKELADTPSELSRRGARHAVTVRDALAAAR